MFTEDISGNLCEGVRLRFVSDVTKLNSCSFGYGEGGSNKVSHSSYLEFIAHKIIKYINVFLGKLYKEL